MQCLLLMEQLEPLPCRIILSAKGPQLSGGRYGWQPLVWRANLANLHIWMWSLDRGRRTAVCSYRCYFCWLFTHGEVSMCENVTNCHTSVIWDTKSSFWCTPWETAPCLARGGDLHSDSARTFWVWVRSGLRNSVLTFTYCWFFESLGCGWLMFSVQSGLNYSKDEILTY